MKSLALIMGTLMPGAVKFTVPTVVDGYVFVAEGAPGYFGSSSTACPPPPAIHPPCFFLTTS